MNKIRRDVFDCINVISNFPNFIEISIYVIIYFIIFSFYFLRSLAVNLCHVIKTSNKPKMKYELLDTVKVSFF